MRILVTGGAGFIGSHLSERLLRDRHLVAIVDELNDFYSPAVKRANLRSVLSAGPATFHQADICDSASMLAIARQEKPDAIVHLAARAGVRPSLEDPLLYEHVNVRGTMVLLEVARQLGIPKFIFASSSSIYGIANRVPFCEEDALNLPISPYAATKIGGEKICFTYSHLYDIGVVCLRFFTVYGPRQRPDLAIHKFARLISQGKPIPFFGDGTAGRDYTFYTDTIEGIVAALHYDCQFDVFNLGNSHPVELNRLIGTLEASLGKKAMINRLPDQPGDVPITYADISKAKQLLGYSPRVPFEQGIDEFVTWFQESTLQTAAVAASS
ncbi:MAG: GDP-mannose 4,6-dehydratase [Candidatus Korobacteraceae bacterium]